MHDLQKILLKRLLDQNNQRFAALTRGYDFDDNVVFHLKRLLVGGLITRSGQHYTLTAKGVKTITSFDLSGLEDTGFKTFFVGFVCEYNGRYLLKEHPLGATNFYNLPSGKPQFGEPIGHALPRLFAACTGVMLGRDAFSFRSLHLKTVKTSTGEVLFDDAFTMYNVTFNQSQFNYIKPANALFWANKQTIESLPNRWPEIDYVLQNDTAPYRTYQVVSDYILG